MDSGGGRVGRVGCKKEVMDADRGLWAEMTTDSNDRVVSKAGGGFSERCHRVSIFAAAKSAFCRFCHNLSRVVQRLLTWVGLVLVLVLCRYILEGKELEFYLKKLQKKKGGKTAA